MNYFKFNEEYRQIYKERFRVIDNTDFEYSYLESELYAIRKIGESDFVIVTAIHPQGNKKLNEKRIHPTQKPVNLYLWLLQKYSKPGYKILDTHVGSGSSMIACQKMNLDFVGFEINEIYYELARKRIKELKE